MITPRGGAKIGSICSKTTSSFSRNAHIFHIFTTHYPPLNRVDETEWIIWWTRITWKLLTGSRSILLLPWAHRECLHSRRSCHHIHHTRRYGNSQDRSWTSPRAYRASMSICRPHRGSRHCKCRTSCTTSSYTIRTDTFKQLLINLHFIIQE